MEIIGTFTNKKDAEDFSISVGRKFDVHIFHETQPDGTLLVRDWGIAPISPQMADAIRAYRPEWEQNGKGLIPIHAYIFDIDGTIRSNDNFQPGDLLPGRKTRLAALARTTPGRIGFASNQGGVAFGYTTEDAVQAGFAAMLTALGLPAETPIAVCYSDSRSQDARYNQPGDCARRKPSGAMIKEVAAQLGRPLNTVTFVGDRSEDEQAAKDAGVTFIWAHEFFGEQE